MPVQHDMSSADATAQKMQRALKAAGKQRLRKFQKSRSKPTSTSTEQTRYTRIVPSVIEKYGDSEHVAVTDDNCSDHKDAKNTAQLAKATSGTLAIDVATAARNFEVTPTTPENASKLSRFGSRKSIASLADLASLIQSSPYENKGIVSPLSASGPTSGGLTVGRRESRSNESFRSSHPQLSSQSRAMIDTTEPTSMSNSVSSPVTTNAFGRNHGGGSLENAASSMQSLKREIRKLEHLCHSRGVELDQLRAENVSMRGQDSHERHKKLYEEHISTITALEKKVKRLLAEKTELSKQREDDRLLRAQFREQQQNVTNDLSRTAEKVDNLTKQLLYTQTQLKSKENIIQQLSQNIQLHHPDGSTMTAEQILAERHAFQKQASANEDRMGALEAELAQRRGDKARYEKDRQEMILAMEEETRQKQAQLVGKIQTLERKVDGLNGERKHLLQRLERATISSPKVGGVRQSVGDAEEMAKLRDERILTQKQYDLLKQQYDRLGGENVKLLQDLQELRKSYVQHTQAKAELATSLDSLTHRLTATEKERNELQSKIKNLSTNDRSIETEAMSRYEQQIRDLSGALATAEKDIETLLGDNTDLEVVKDSLSQEKASLTKSHSIELEKVQNEKALLLEQHRALAQKADDLAAKLSAAIHPDLFQRMQEDHESLVARYQAQQERMNEEMGTDKTELVEKCASLAKKVAVMEVDLASAVHASEHEELRTAHERLQRQHESLLLAHSPSLSNRDGLGEAYLALEKRNKELEERCMAFEVKLSVPENDSKSVTDSATSNEAMSASAQRLAEMEETIQTLSEHIITLTNNNATVTNELGTSQWQCDQLNQQLNDLIPHLLLEHRQNQVNSKRKIDYLVSLIEAWSSANDSGEIEVLRSETFRLLSDGIDEVLVDTGGEELASSSPTVPSSAKPSPDASPKKQPEPLPTLKPSINATGRVFRIETPCRGCKGELVEI